MTAVPKRKLGRNGPLVSALGFGAMGMSAFYNTTGPSGEEEYLKVLNHGTRIPSEVVRARLTKRPFPKQ